MQNGKYGCFIIRRSSNPGCLALSHKQSDGTFGHALIQYNGSGYSLEQTTQSYDTIEGLIKSLDLRLEDVKKNRPRPAQVFGQPVLFQVWNGAATLCAALRAFLFKSRLFLRA